MRKLSKRRAGVHDSMPCGQPEVRRRRLDGRGPWRRIVAINRLEPPRGRAQSCYTVTPRFKEDLMAGSPLLTIIKPTGAIMLTAALLVLAVSAVAHAHPLSPIDIEHACAPGSSCFTLVACDGALYSTCFKACMKSPQNPQDPPQSSIQKSYHCNKDCNSRSGCSRR
jgi:hypothetical protein